MAEKEYIGIAVHKDVYQQLKSFSIRTKSSMSSTISLLLDHYNKTSELPEILQDLTNEIKSMREEIKLLKEEINEIRKKIENQS